MLTKAIPIVIVFGGVVGLLMPSGPASNAKRGRTAAPQTAAASPKAATGNGLDTVIERSPDGHFYVDAMVNDRVIHFVVDTGASMIALTKEDARTAGVDFNEYEFKVVARGASGDVRGKEIELHHVAIDQKEAWDVDAVVVDDGLDVSLLGQTYLEQVGQVSISGDKMTLR